MSKRKLLYTRADGKNIYDGMADSQISSDSDSTSDTEPIECEDTIDEIRQNHEAQDYSQCRRCGNKLISYEEAERITRSEAATFVQLHAGKLIELETVRFLAKQRKMNGPPALRGPKSTVAAKPKKKQQSNKAREDEQSGFWDMH